MFSCEKLIRLTERLEICVNVLVSVQSVTVHKPDDECDEKPTYDSGMCLCVCVCAHAPCVCVCACRSIQEMLQSLSVAKVLWCSSSWTGVTVIVVISRC